MKDNKIIVRNNINNRVINKWIENIKNKDNNIIIKYNVESED